MTQSSSELESKPLTSKAYEALSKTRSNIYYNYNIMSATKRAEYRTASTVLTLLILMCLCCHLPSANCAKDVKVSQNSVKALLSAESSSTEKAPEAPPRAKPDSSSEPSTQPKLRKPKDNENQKEPRIEKDADFMTKERLKSGPNKSRQMVTKLKSQDVKETKREARSEKRSMPFKLIGFPKSMGIRKELPSRSQQSLPIRNQQPSPKNEILEEKEFCQPKSLVHYNVTFIPMWSSKRFPKMYPTYRPNAQWSKVIGRTHDYSYSMWKLDTFAGPAVKSFAEGGKTADFDTETQGENGVYDMFTMPAINKGVGRSRGTIFLDGSHPLVSLMVKIVPSPDWFVGVSNLNLCSRGKWRKKAVMKLFPADAGTDKGLTFTSPNWPSYPPEKIHRITASDPSHDASSFYYPKLKKLPRIGYVIFHKIAEARIILKRQKPYKIHLAGVSDGSVSETNEDTEIPNGSNKPTTLVQSDERLGDNKPETASISKDTMEKTPVKIGIVDNDPGTALDCRVSNWGHWTECSKTCGFGRRERHRFVTQQKKNQGLICPKLKEEELCGSMRNCQWNHFQPFRWQTLQNSRLSPSRRH